MKDQKRVVSLPEMATVFFAIGLLISVAYACSVPKTIAHSSISTKESKRAAQ